MSKLVDIIKRIVKQEIKAQNNEIHVPCIIESVSDDYLRADVSLLADPDVIIPNRLNKSGEKLTEGQQAWLYYTTLPSSGYIGRTEGEADPMGGGGSGTTVENAAVLVPTNFHDYVINEQLIVGLQPPNMVYYGEMPSFLIAQGHYCILSDSMDAKYNSNTGLWELGSDTTGTLYSRIVANKSKFGSQIGDATGGGWLSCKDTSKTYPSQYQYVIFEPYQYSDGSYTFLGRHGTAATNAPSGNWWENGIDWGVVTLDAGTSLKLYAADGTFDIGALSDVFAVPVCTSINASSSDAERAREPFGRVRVNGYWIFASSEIHPNSYGVRAWTISSGTPAMSRAPLVSEAERCFAWGISQHTEPVPSN